MFCEAPSLENCAFNISTLCLICGEGSCCGEPHHSFSCHRELCVLPHTIVIGSLQGTLPHLSRRGRAPCIIFLFVSVSVLWGDPDSAGPSWSVQSPLVRHQFFLPLLTEEGKDCPLHSRHGPAWSQKLLLAEPSAKWKQVGPCSPTIMNFQSVTEEH